MPAALSQEEVTRRFIAADDSVLQAVEREFHEAHQVREAMRDPERRVDMADLDRHIARCHARVLNPFGRRPARPKGLLGCAVVLAALLDTEHGIVSKLTRAESECLENIYRRLRDACDEARPGGRVRGLGNHDMWWEREKAAAAAAKQPRVAKRNGNVVPLDFARRSRAVETEGGAA